ncbi:hypothetical protein [Roseateles saccharophilus]|uniref:Uncharacterized protein n=1 Tax=Roseateles saccharophilus TaxID=304 RepID=A0A4R3UM89_ROSSA|nr:hypothetical protein [Roseateles saccharophilus]MDG0834181.1 hypothetical protein [Roseateles saccharophilus]TCU91298.1 hypothetical protein EV671_102613 [Roseateles saccharophilus]
MSPDIGAGAVSIAKPEELWHLAGQVDAVNAIALLSITAPGEARQQLLRTLPLCDAHPSLTWVWQVLVHACTMRQQELAAKSAERALHLADRPRELHTDCAGILLVDDGGAAPIEAFDDETAICAFVDWLHHRRAERDRESVVARRRHEFRLVGDPT